MYYFKYGLYKNRLTNIGEISAILQCQGLRMRPWRPLVTILTYSKLKETVFLLFYEKECKILGFFSGDDRSEVQNYIVFSG